MVHNSPQECDSKRIIAVKVYQPKLALVGQSQHKLWRWYNVVFGLAILLQSAYMLTSMGQPYHDFLAKADREGFQVMQGSTQRRAQFEYVFADLNDPGRRTKKIGWMDWQDMGIEELAAEKKRDREKSVLDSLPKNMRVPSPYSCAFWPTFFLGVIATLYALVVLLQYWRVDFDVWLNYRELDPDKHEIPEDLLQIDVEQDLEEQAKRRQQSKEAAHCIPDRKLANLPPHFPTCARITPAKGPEILVEVEYYPTLGMTFEFHRRRYVYRSAASAGGGSTPCWTKIRCQTNFSVDILKTWKGFPSPLQLIGGQIRYGPNMFTVKQPSFVDLYKKQLLNPFSIFQMFCVLLWAIDDYILYSMFNLFMVFVFEATVVFQRIQSMKALRGMGNPSRNIYVYRSNQWAICDSTELLPGDVMSLKRVAPHRVKDAVSNKPKVSIADDGGDVVPADLLLLRGSTVVNEASLTGESIPQMKEGLVDLEEGGRVDMKIKHKMNVAYAGTKMLQCKGAAEVEADSSGRKLYSQIPNPPDEGCICFVLRTGFSSAQGKLVRMIEGSHEKVKGHERETGLLLLFLFCFAVMSSSYVLYHGMQNEKRSKYELLLHCIMIVTNVIRPELPMQMALAVNNSLMTLMKMHIFCTEPYRVPMAGKLDVCLFDKTGTLTTDELVAAGVCEPKKLKALSGREDEDTQFLTHMTSLNGAAALVLAGCHSLVVVDEETAGDPLEKASLASMRWQLSVSTGHATPAPATEKKPAGHPIVLDSGTPLIDVDIVTRHHFSSKLQRMSCVIKASGKMFSVAKGSPEAIGLLLASKPTGYDEKAAFLSKQGYRVISLAWKPLESESVAQQAMENRAACEQDLIFAGFIAFTCMVRKDTASVLNRLKEGGMTCAMVTGDALLTAIHVAREVEIFEPLNKTAGDEVTETNEELKALILAKRGISTSDSKKDERKIFRNLLYLEADDEGDMFWARYEDASRAEDFVASRVPHLAVTHDLATTGANLALAYEYDPEIMVMLEHIKVFARMTPDAKEKVIECLHSIGKLTLMCGDGANDVGALKASSVGVALLSGFGNINVQKDEDDEKAEKRDDGVRSIMSQEHLREIRALPVFALKMKIRSLGCDPANYPELKEKEDLVQLYQIKARELAVKRHDEKNKRDAKKMTPAEQREEQRRKMEEKQQWVQRRVEELEAKGESWAQIKAVKEFVAMEMKDAQQKKAEMSKFSGVEGQAAMLASKLDEMDSGDVPMIKLGDASVAAPFTSKMPSIRNCVDIVRQGRCTLVNSMQMFQIMALECLISSYSLSVLYLDGVKYGDTQMTAMGILGSVSFMSVSRSKPLDKLSPVRPLTSIFHPAKFFSLLGQFVIHLGVMLFAVHSAKKHLPPDYEPDLDGTFQPGILNTCVFLVSSVQQVTVFVVNLQGRPFMTGLSENRPLLWSLLGTFILTFMFASETVPGLNRYFQLVPFPDDKFRDFLLVLLVMDLVATMALDRLMQFLFCRDILIASVKDTTWKDVFGILRTFAVISVIMGVFFGNEETWEQLLELQNNLTYATMEDEALSGSVADCVGDMCDAVNETVAAVLDEF